MNDVINEKGLAGKGCISHRALGLLALYSFCSCEHDSYWSI